MAREGSGVRMLSRWIEGEVARSRRGHRDRAFIDRLLPWMERWARYFDAEVRGLEKVPREGPVMLVGNHSGGALAPDVAALLAAWFREREAPLTGLAFDAAFAVPVLGSVLRRLGLLPASPLNAARVLRRGEALLVYPGGAHEVFRPWTARNRVDFGGHKGFVRLALKEGVPVYPVVSHGAHHTLFVLRRGQRLARWLGLDGSLRVKVFPLLLPLPPLPAKIVVELGEPLPWSLAGGDPDDAATVSAAYHATVEALQTRLDGLAREVPAPLLGRLR